MSPSQELLVVAIVLYLCECVAAVSRRAVVFQSLWPRRFRAREVSLYPGTDSKALALKMPLPPLGTLYETQFCPVSLSPDGLCAQPAHYLNDPPPGAASTDFVRFEEVCEVAARGSSLLVNGSLFADCGTSSAATLLSRFIDRLRTLPAAKRQRRIEAAIRRSLDIERVERLHRTHTEVSAVLRFDCSCLCLYLFVFCPLIAWYRGLAAIWWMLLLAFVPLCLLTVIAFARAHRVVFPTRATGRRQQTAFLACLPLSLIRGCDTLLRYALVGYHPLAVSSALCGAHANRPLVRQILADLMHPVEGGDDGASPLVTETKAWMRARLRECVLGNLRAAGVDPDALLESPIEEDPNARAYCPRCSMQFEGDATVCPYCPGVVLRSFDARASGPSPSEATAPREPGTP